MRYPESKREQAAQLIAEGIYDQKKIMEELGIGKATLWRWKQEPEFQQRVYDLNKMTFLESSAQAIKRLVELMNSKNDPVALGAAKEILHLAGYDAPLKIQAAIENKNLNINVNIDET